MIASESLRSHHHTHEMFQPRPSASANVDCNMRAEHHDVYLLSNAAKSLLNDVQRLNENATTTTAATTSTSHLNGQRADETEEAATDPHSKVNGNGASSLHPQPITTDTEQFIRKCTDEIIRMAVIDGTDRSSKVIDWHTPEQLRSIYDFPLRQEAESHDTLYKLLQQTISYSVKTGHPYFVNQLYSGVDPYALIGQWLTDALNPSVYTFEVAPVFTLMEEEVLHEMRRLVGFPDDGFGDGIFCPGGSIANGYAISCARYHKLPQAKVIFSSYTYILFSDKLALFPFISINNGAFESLGSFYIIHTIIFSDIRAIFHMNE